MNYSFKYIAVFCLFLFLVAFALGEFLDTMPLIIWDESRQAANAIEMYTNHNWLVTYYNGMPDLWNTKPPLLIWCQVLFMNVFGCSVSSLRGVSAVAGILTTVVLFNFVRKNTGNIWIGFFSGIALVTMEGFNGFHATRTADYDALLTLFSLLFIIQFYYYLNSFDKKHILLFFLFLCLATLTKGIASMLFMPAFLLYALIEKKVITILKDPYFYAGCLGFVLIVGLYYIVREQASPGYLQAVYMNELGGRYLDVTEGHSGNAFFYIQWMSLTQTDIWFVVFLLGIISLPFYYLNMPDKKLFQYLFILCICYVLVLTSSETKITWYVVPVLPLLAAICMLLLYNAVAFVCITFSLEKKWAERGAFTIALILLSFSYTTIISRHNHPVYVSDYEVQFYKLSKFLHDKPYPVSDLNIKITDTPNGIQHLIFYVKRLQLKKPSVGFADYKNLAKGDAALITDEQTNEYIKANYSVNELYQKDGLHLYAIK